MEFGRFVFGYGFATLLFGGNVRCDLNCFEHLNFFSICSIGGESLAVAQNTYAVNWFKGKELNLVFGLQLSMARVVRKDSRVASLGRRILGIMYNFGDQLSLILGLVPC